MKTEPIRYWIMTNSERRKRVTGLAVKPSPWMKGLRFCVRESAPNTWRVEHFDSGFAIPGTYAFGPDGSLRLLRARMPIVVEAIRRIGS